MQHEPASNYAGLFTLINAALHLVVSQVIRRMQLADRSLYYLILGLVIVFCTIAVPVQLDGNWVTLLWTTEAVLVFLIGRMRKAPAYEKLGAALAILSFLSFVQDSARHSFDFTYAYRGTVRPFMNIVFATGLLVAAAQAVMIYYNRNKKYESMLPATGLFRWFYDSALLAMFIVTSYFVFVIEIHGYFKLLEKPGAIYDTFYGIWNTRISAFAFVVTLLYSMAFDIVLMVINLRWGRSKALAGFSLTAIVIMTVLLITEALPVLNELTTTWFQKEGGYFGALEFLIRYVVVAFTAILLYAGNQARAAFIPDGWLQKAWPLLVHAITLSFLSAEYLCWANSSGSDNQYKLGLSILWGIYALGLVVLGIRKKQKHLRLAGIVLFSITLIKLFLYDLAGSGTITKTVSFISLGVLLLVVSFLYNKYKEVLFGEPDAGKSDS
jgi:uncharacterized membrane protein